MKFKPRFFFIFMGIVLFLISFCGVRVSAKDNETLKKELEKEFAGYQRNDHFSGSVLIVKHGAILLKKSYGMADYEHNIPNSPGTKFKLGCISKQFTAMCIMMLQERGLLKVGDKLKQYLPDYPNGDKITIYDLLTHTSGIAEYTTPDFIQLATRHYTPKQLVALFKDKPLSCHPGTKFEFRDANYVLLGLVIEKVSKTSFEDFITQNIFIPLNLKNTGCDHNETDSSTAVGYKYQFFRFVKADFVDMSMAYATGGLYATIDDLYKWDQALYTEKLLKKENLKALFQPNRFGYAYGWVIHSKYPNFMSHGGGINGFKAMIFRDIAAKDFVVVLCNNESFNGKIYHQILRTVIGKDVTIIL